MIKGHTYLLEIICHKYEILIKYPFEGLILLHAYNQNGYEYTFQYLSEICSKIHGLRLVNKLDLKQCKIKCIQDVKDYAYTLDGTLKEGLIVKFNSGFRIKFYGEQYF